MKTAIPADATLRTLAGTLVRSVDFVRSVLENMTGYYQDCQVRAACNSDPRRPDYLLEMLFFDQEDGAEVVHRQSVTVFQGKTQKGACSMDDRAERVWSDSAMSFREVQQLLGDLRGVDPKKFKIPG